MAVKRKDATAMDDLIEKITREVMNRMSSQSSAPAVVPTASRRVLVVISGAVKAADTVFAGLKSLSLKGWKLTGVLTTSAENIWGADRLSAAAGFQQCLTGNVFNLAHELLRNHEAVVLAVPSINTLAKVASLTCDNPATAILHEAILNGVPVLVVVDSLNAAVATAAPAVKRRVQELINTVSSYGARPISLGELSDVLGGGRAAMPQAVGARGETAFCSPVQCSSSPPAMVCDASSGECSACGLCVVYRKSNVNELLEAGAERIGAKTGVVSVEDQVAGIIDHTLLKPDATYEQIQKICEEARKHQFASVCVNPGYVETCVTLLKGSGVMVCTVVGFPLGATTSEAKAFETADAVRKGADEIDMVINVGSLKAGNFKLVEDDIKAVVQAACGRPVKVILETALLTDEEKIMGCTLSKAAGASFVKTSTGFGPGGATAHDIALMRKTVGPDLGVKASGGVRDMKTVLQMVEAGATRIGASASVKIVSGGDAGGEGY